MTIKIICDRNQPQVEDAFGRLGEVVTLPFSQITREALRGADALICRSTVKVNAALLEGTPVKFVGTCTIGTDHVDEAYLRARGIGFAAAPGCNANSVSEYILAAILNFSVARDWPLRGKTVGIVGVGNVGKLLAPKAEALGLRVLLNDPPRAEAEGSAGFTPLPQLLDESDIVTLHVPLEKGGAHPTFEMADAAFFARMKPGALFLNAARGKAVREEALLAALQAGKIGGAVLDVFYNEPTIPPELHDALFLATPHIAGHSFDGKVVGTQMIFDAMCRHFGVAQSWDYHPGMPEPEVDIIEMEPSGYNEADLLRLVEPCYNILRDDRTLRADPGCFAHYRQEYPLRLEFSHTQVVTTDPKWCQIASRLGFVCRDSLE